MFYTDHLSTCNTLINVFPSNWVQRFLKGLSRFVCTAVLKYLPKNPHISLYFLLNGAYSYFNHSTKVEPVLYTRLVVRWDGADL